MLGSWQAFHLLGIYMLSLALHHLEMPEGNLSIDFLSAPSTFYPSSGYVVLFSRTFLFLDYKLWRLRADFCKTKNGFHGFSSVGSLDKNS